MVSSIQLGNFFTSGGKTVSGGSGGSGLDTQTLIKGLTDAKLIPATQLQDKIKINDGQSAALTKFQTLLSTFRDTVAALRNPPGVGNAADDAFKYRTTNISTNTGATGTDYVSVTASPGTALQTYTIDSVISLANARKQYTGDINIATADTAAVSASSAPGSGLFKPGTFSLRGITTTSASGVTTTLPNQSITLNDGETLNSVAAKFNAVSDKTGISASIIKISTGKFELSFSATKTGTANDFDLTNASPAGTIDDTVDGVFANITMNEGQPASDAKFNFNNVPITRSSNNITDLVDGLTFNLNQTTVAAPTTQLNISVAPDQTIVKNSIVNFMNAYNAVKVFAAGQSELNADGTYKDTAVLHDSSMFRTTMDAISSQVSSVVNGLTAGNPTGLSDLGITFTDQAATADAPKVRNVLTVDDTKLESAISSNPDGVRKVFEFDFNSDNTALRVISRTNSLAASNFALTINPTTNTYQATYNNGSGNVTVDLNATAVVNSVSGLTTGYTLKGKTGTALEGLVMIYVGTTDTTANVTTTQGIADKLFNIADPALTTDTGSIAVELNSLKDADTRLNDNIAKINADVDAYRQTLLDKFARLEQAVSSINTVLSSITANDSARNNSNG